MVKRTPVKPKRTPVKPKRHPNKPPPNRDPFAGAKQRGGVVMGSKQGKPALTKIEPPPSVKEQDSQYSNKFLRYAAGTYYVTDIHGCTLEQMTHHPVFGQVALPTLKRWSGEDGWVAQREANWAKWRQKLEQKVGNDLMQSRVATVSTLKDVQQSLLDMLGPTAKNPLVIKSFGEVVNALLKTTDMLDKTREKMASDLTEGMKPEDQAVHQGAPIHMRNKLTEGELLAAAHGILRHKLDKQRAALKAANPEGGDDGPEGSDNQGK